MTRHRTPRTMPDPIDDTPENIARAILAQPPKQQWRYLEGHTAQDRQTPTDPT
ncbi:hypothetical protein [Candidatus Poriferisocius sp.]|uniref:hypothetical protein n=1 Tax=Candidatus Poriferisocius sp. TaxID=3101276 RepID=UPI003B0165E3